MSTLSKVFVVLVLLAAAALAMTSIAHLATVDNFKVKLDKVTKDLATANATITNVTAERDAEKTAHTDTRTKLAAQVSTLEGNLKTLTSAKESVDLELGNLKTTLSTITADLASVKKELATAVASNSDLNKNLDAAQKARDEALEAKRDSDQRLMDSQNQVKILKDDKQASEKRITELMGFVKKLQDERDKLLAMLPGIEPGPLTGERTPLIEGVVTNVQTSSEGLTLVQLSVGSTSDVKKGMKFIVFSTQDGFKADIQIEQVEANSSVGKVIAGAKPIVKGDRAKTQLQGGA